MRTENTNGQSGTEEHWKGCGEKEFRILMDKAPDAIIIADMNGKIVDVNPKACSNLLYSHDELLGMKIADIQPMFDLVERKTLWEVLGPGDTYTVEEEYFRKDGSSFPVEVHVTIFESEKENYLFKAARDIRIRKHTELALKESEKRYRQLYSMMRLMCDNVPDMIWAKDLERMYIFANRATARHLLNAKNTDEPIGKTDMFFAERERRAHPDNPHWHDFGEMCTDSDQIVLEAGKPMRFDEFGNALGRFLHLDVHKAPFFDENRNLIGTVGCGRDVTLEKRESEKRRKAEEELMASEQKYRQLVESANSVVLRWDKNGRIRFINRYGLSLFGYQKEEILGKSLLETILPEKDSRSGRKLDKLVKELIENPEKYIVSENENITRDGKRLWMSWTNRVIRDENGEVEEVLCIGTDMTEKKELQSQLNQARKMEALGTMAGGIAHEFNNLLSIILGNAELLSEEFPNYNSARVSVEEILSAAMRARDEVRKIVCLAQNTFSKKRPARMTRIVTNTLRILEPSIPPGIKLETKFIADRDRVMADSDQIERVLLELCRNAFYAMGKDGGLLGITLETISLRKKENCEYGSLDAGDYIVLSVKDSGTGMPPGIRERIFEPYFTTKSIGTGTGLGLPVALGIVKAHGGVIRVGSQEGSGSRFRVFLPVNEKRDMETAPSAEQKMARSDRVK